MNDDASTFDLPEYIHSRLQPQILIDFPERDEEYQILKENLPFGDEQILNYVTDFLQQAHAADERYTVRDGINIARFAMKLQRGAAPPETSGEALEIAIEETLGEEALRYVPRVRPERRQPGRGRVHLLPGRAGTAGVRHRSCGGRCLRTGREVVAVELPWTLERRLSARRRAPAGDVGHPLPRGRRGRRPRHLRSGRAGRSVHRGRPHGLEIGAEVVFVEPDFGERRTCPTVPRPVRDSTASAWTQYVEAYRSTRSRARTRSPRTPPEWPGSCRAPIPLADVFVVVSLNLLDPLLSTPWRSRRRSRRRALRRATEVDLLNPHPDCLAEITSSIPTCSTATSSSGRAARPDTLADRRRAQLDAVARRGEGPTRKHRRAAGALAAAAAGALHAQSGACNRRPGGRRCSTSPWRRAQSWTTTTAGTSGRPPNRYPPQKAESDLETVNLSGEEVWLNTRRNAAAAAAAQPKQRLRPAGSKPRKKEKFPGEWARADRRQRHLLLSARGPGDRGLRPLPPEEGQEHSLGRARARASRSPRRCSTASTCARPFATGTRARSTCGSSTRVAGEVGSVVVIFDEDRDDRYPYLTTWLGEHQNESDMAFYSTDPFENIWWGRASGAPSTAAF